MSRLDTSVAVNTSNFSNVSENERLFPMVFNWLKNGFLWNSNFWTLNFYEIQILKIGFQCCSFACKSYFYGFQATLLDLRICVFIYFCKYDILIFQDFFCVIFQLQNSFFQTPTDFYFHHNKLLNVDYEDLFSSPLFSIFNFLTSFSRLSITSISDIGIIVLNTLLKTDSQFLLVC